MSERTKRLQAFQEKQQKYWVERAERNVLQAEKSADELLAIMQNSYKEANKVIENQIRDFYSRFAYNQQISYEEVLKRLDKSQLKLFKDQAKLYYDEAYAKHWQTAYTDKMRTLSGKAYMSRLEELKVNIAHEYQKIAEELNVKLEDGLLNQYTKSFEEAMFNVAHQTGVGLEMPQINSDIVKRTIKEKWVGGNYSDRIWENKDKLVEVLNKDLPTMFTLGKHPNVVAQMLSGKLENNYKNTVRLVRTEFNRIANESTADAYSEYGIDKYEILSTLDSRTSEICAEMDGKVFEFKNREIGVNYPPFHPNCRTTTVPYFPEDVNDKRIGRDSKGKNFHVPASMKFEEWHERAYGYKKYNKDGETYVYDNKKPKPVPQPKPVPIPQAKPEPVEPPKPKPEKKKKAEKVVKHSEPFNKLYDRIKNIGIEFKEVEKHNRKPSEEKIISMLSGGDRTSGSCASVGLAYIGQKQGWNVLDFRDGMSRRFFSSGLNLRELSQLEGLKVLKSEGACSLTVGNRLLKQVEEGKEYYLAVGKHASIVRKKGGQLQYLELQSANNSGWTNFNGNPRYTLNKRFGCTKTSDMSAYIDFMIDIEESDFTVNNEFKELLGYLNTAEDKQRKGTSGTIK